MKYYVTLSAIMSLGPCYTKESVYRKLGKQKRMSVFKFCRLRTVNNIDKLWLLLRPDYIPEKQLHMLAIHWAREHLRHLREDYIDVPDKYDEALVIKQLWVEEKVTGDTCLHHKLLVGYPYGRFSLMRDVMYWRGREAAKGVASELSMVGNNRRDRKSTAKTLRALIDCVEVMLEWLHKEKGT